MKSAPSDGTMKSIINNNNNIMFYITAISLTFSVQNLYFPHEMFVGFIYLFDCSYSILVSCTKSISARLPVLAEDTPDQPLGWSGTSFS